MVQQNYAVKNLSFRDKYRKNDYLVERVNGREHFHMPKTMSNYKRLYPFTPIEFYATDAKKDLDNEKYTKSQFENKLQDFTFEIERRVNQRFYDPNQRDEPDQNSLSLYLNSVLTEEETHEDDKEEPSDSVIDGNEVMDGNEYI